ncbi:hypothetical protein [Streptomyces lunaelactis]|uniref:hypothetical protein n=1 Tax=Streptomyces lunaelactis TaxID=1535768 RepID=UPI001585A362|nr:hypothetical protein [Streptomyces lunaelactis]
MQEGGCGCCGTTAAISAERSSGAISAVKARLLAGAKQLGIADSDLAGLAEVYDGGDCAAVQARMAQLVTARLTASGARLVELIEQAARLQASRPEEVAQVQGRIVELGGTVGQLQAAVARLSGSAAHGLCGQDCACVTAASAVTAPRVPAGRMALSAGAAAGGGADIVCTLDGGTDAMRDRITEWQAVIGRSTGRVPANGGVTLAFDHDSGVAVELARLAAAEFACCSFFTFTLTIGPMGMQFTVSAPDEARDVVTAVFGTATTRSGEN